MQKFAIKQDGIVNQRLVFNSHDEAVEGVGKSFNKMELSDAICSVVTVVAVWEFDIWFRNNDEKDSILFYSDRKHVDEAIDEAVKEIRGSFAVVMPEFGVVGRYNEKIENEMLNTYKNTQC